MNACTMVAKTLGVTDVTPNVTPVAAGDLNVETTVLFTLATL